MSVNDKFGLGYGDYRYGSILSYENEVLQTMCMNKASDLEDTSVNDRYANGMHVVPSPMTGNYIPSGPDVEIDYSKFIYGPKQTSVDESDSKPFEYASCESESSVETTTSMPEPIQSCRILRIPLLHTLSCLVHLEAPPSLDYVTGPEYPPSSEFVPESVYPEFMPVEDDIPPAKEQPLPAAASLATESDPDKDPKDDPEEDPEDDPEEDLADYPADGGDEGNDEDDSFDDEEDDDIDIEGDEEEDEPQTPISLPSDTEIAKHMAIPTPPPLPLSLLSLPLPPIPSPPLPLLSPPPTDPTYEEAPLGYREARLRWRAEREEILKADLPLRNRLCTAHTVTYELEESSAAATFRLREPVMDELYSSHPGNCTNHREGGQSEGD
nr:hypothetical protein [Tanacetum cinerariifolium]